MILPATTRPGSWPKTLKRGLYRPFLGVFDRPKDSEGLVPRVGHGSLFDRWGTTTRQVSSRPSLSEPQPGFAPPTTSQRIGLGAVVWRKSYMLNSLQSCWMPRSDESRSSWSGIVTCGHHWLRVATNGTYHPHGTHLVEQISIDHDRKRCNLDVDPQSGSMMDWGLRWFSIWPSTSTFHGVGMAVGQILAKSLLSEFEKFDARPSPI